MHFKKRFGIYQFSNNPADVVRLVRVGGYNGVQLLAQFVAFGVIIHRCLLIAVLRYIVQQLFNRSNTLHLIRVSKMRNARFGSMRLCTAQFLAGNILMRNGFNHVGTGYKHITGVLHHHNKIGNGRRVNRPTGTRPEDGRYLRHHTTGNRIAVKYIGITT